MITIIIQLMIAKFKGERVFVMVLRPDIERTVTHITGMSVALAKDGMQAVIAYLIQRGERINFTEEEIEEFGIKQ